MVNIPMNITMNIPMDITMNIPMDITMNIPMDIMNLCSYGGINVSDFSDMLMYDVRWIHSKQFTI